MEKTFSATDIRMGPLPSLANQTHVHFSPWWQLKFSVKMLANYVLILSWPRNFFHFKKLRPWILLQFFDLIIKSSHILCACVRVCMCEGVKLCGCAGGRVEELPDIKLTGCGLLTLANFHSFPWNCAFPDRIFSHLAINRSMFFCLDIIDAIFGHF